MRNPRSQPSFCRSQRWCGRLPWRRHPVSCISFRNRIQRSHPAKSKPSKECGQIMICRECPRFISSRSIVFPGLSVLPERAYWRGNVQSREPTYAVRHESFSNLENVLLDNRKTVSNLLGIFWDASRYLLPELSSKVYGMIQAPAQAGAQMLSHRCWTQQFVGSRRVCNPHAIPQDQACFRRAVHQLTFWLDMSE